MHDALQATRRLGADEVEVLIPAERLRARVAEIGQEITRDHDGRLRNLPCVGVVKE
jgi:hypoxanthine-guanine phosphoribosyltransferase